MKQCHKCLTKTNPGKELTTLGGLPAGEHECQLCGEKFTITRTVETKKSQSREEVTR